MKRVLVIELRKRSVYNKVYKTAKLCQGYKNCWYCVFHLLKEKGALDVRRFNTPAKLKAALNEIFEDELVNRFITQLRELYDVLGADTCKSLHDEIAKELRAWVAKLRAGYRANLPTPRDLDRLYRFTLSVNPNMLVDKRLFENKLVVRLSKATGALKFPVPEWLTSKVHVKIQFNIDLPVRVLVTYEKTLEEDTGAVNLDRKKVASVDLGINNLITCVSNTPEFPTIVYSGKELKTVNQLVNKLNAKSDLSPRDKRRLWRWRDKLILQHSHAFTNHLVEALVRFGIGTLIVPKSVSSIFHRRKKLSAQSEQIIRMIPLGKLLNILKYKAEEAGIDVVDELDESYTSKISIFDVENLTRIIGKNVDEIEGVQSRVIRRKGLLEDRVSGARLHADINAAFVMMVKVLGLSILCQLLKQRAFNVKLHNPVVFRDLQGLRPPLPLRNGARRDRLPREAEAQDLSSCERWS